MKLFFSLTLLLALITSCNNNATSSSFCDTACNNDTIKYELAEHPERPRIKISVKNCVADSLTWYHKAMPASRQIHLEGFFDQQLRLNAKAINCFINDTSNVWLTFNDCITGRGYMVMLPFDKKGDIKKSTAALNSFDPKFSVSTDMRAYAIKSGMYAVNVKTGKEEFMTFKEEYDIDWNNIHKTIDSVNVTPQRMYVSLFKNGKEIPIEKKIAL